MSDDELMLQFKRCQLWQDPEQWELLAVAYDQRGYFLNALCCLAYADRCRTVIEPVSAETESVS